MCRYIPSPCPYVNHLIQSYHKHYTRDLETIPEEESCLASFIESAKETSPLKETPQSKHQEFYTKITPIQTEPSPNQALKKKQIPKKNLSFKDELEALNIIKRSP